MLVAACAGILLGVLDDDDRAPRAPGPAAVRVRLLEPWQQSVDSRGTSSWSARALARSTRQGRSVTTVPWQLRLRLVTERPPRGPELRLRGQLRAPARFLNGGWSPPADWVLHVKSDRLVEASTDERDPASARRAVLDRIETRAGAAAPWYRALLLGDRSELPAASRRQLEAYGLAHLFAVSGLHLGIALAIVGLILGRRSGVPGACAVVAVCSLALWVAGGRPSLVRAASMACLGAVAGATGRRPWTWNLLGVAPLLLVLLVPARGADLSLQLSLAATAGILASASRPRRSPNRTSVFIRPLTASIRASLGALWLTAPWTVSYFCSFPLLSPLLNLVYVPLAALALAGGLICLVAPAGGTTGRGLLELLVRPFEAAAGWRPRPHLNLALTPDPWSAVLWLGGLRLVWPGSTHRRRAIGRVLVAALALLVEGVPSRSGPSVALTFYDVGQGDAMSLRDGDRHLLVDGGGWRRDGLGVRVLLPALLAQGLHSIDLLVLSHADRDHCGGLVEIATRLRVRELWINALDREVDCGRELARLIELQGGRVVAPRAGDRRRLGRTQIEVLPGLTAAQRANDRSLLLQVRVHGRRLWLLGDASSEAERHAVAGRSVPGRIDLLKVAHHGSRTSTSVDLLVATRPRHAWIGVGRNNSYGHPAAQVLERLGARGVRVWRTDRHGAIHLEIPPRGPMRFRTEALPSLR